MAYRALGLIRLSTEEQAAESDGRAGLLRQRQEIRLAQQRWNLEIVDTIEIIDVSGTNVQNAPDFQAFLHRIREVDGVVLANLDRLMRPNDFSSFAVYDVFLNNGKLIFTPGQVIDVREDSGFLQAGIQSIMAGLDRKKILRMTQMAKEENRKRGRLANAKITLPQGVDFDFKIGEWSWVEPYATRIRTAFEIFLTGQQSIKAIAKRLGYKTDRTLYNHLRNPIWTGWRVYTHKRGNDTYERSDGRQTDRKKVRRLEPLRVKINIEPLITEEQFEQAQVLLARLGQEWRSSRTTEARFEAVGILYCACGQKMYSSSGQRHGLHRRDYYRCKSSHAGNNCGRPHVERESIHHTLHSFVTEFFTRPETVISFLNAAITPVHDGSKLKRAEQEISRLKREQQKLLDLALKGLFPETQIEAQARTLQTGLAMWQAIETSARRNKELHSTQHRTKVATMIASVMAEFPFLQAEQRKKLLNQLFRKVYLDDGAISRIILNLPAAKTRIHSRADLRMTSAENVSARRLKSSDTCRKSPAR